MKTMALLIASFLYLSLSFAQQWVDTTYVISSVYDVEYGSSIDFKGAEYPVQMDVSVPTNDAPPDCGRPLMVVVHGGAWLSGDKGDGNVVRLREDFAKRGYVTAAVNYRLGLFNTNLQIDCILEGWKCWNMTDSSEWYRANYRAIQDVKGAIRYLVNQKEEYNINPDNVFLAGESAGGFIVLGVGFIDDEVEVLEELVGEYPDAPAPNAIYENECIQQRGLANSIEEMDLSRPSLGPIEGTLNLPVQDSFRIRGVGSFYGAAFNNIFETHTTSSPALYMFHQPCDLIVPFGYNKILAGYSSCATGFPTFCQYVINRPFAYGSGGIVALIDEMTANNTPTCEYLFDNSGNTYSCLEQVLNPALSCHAIDNYWQRTTNMAAFFAEKIGDCTISNNALITPDDEISIYPNPVKEQLTVKLPSIADRFEVKIMDVLGAIVFSKTISNGQACLVDMKSLKSGVYRVIVEIDGEFSVYPVVKML